MPASSLRRYPHARLLLRASPVSPQMCGIDAGFILVTAILRLRGWSVQLGHSPHPQQISQSGETPTKQLSEIGQLTPHQKDLYPRTGEKDPFSKLTPGDHIVELNNMIAKGTQKVSTP